MTLDELRERIKNEIVRNDGDVADWQWPATGLPREATELGVTDFRRLVNDVSRQLNPNFGRILELKAAIEAKVRERLVWPGKKELSSAEMDDFVSQAERLGLSKGFVADQWIPAILATIPDPEPVKQEVPPSPTTPPPPVPTTFPAPEPVRTEPVRVPSGETAESVQQKIKDILDDYNQHIPAQAIRSIFRAINYNEAALADAVLNYLTTNFYASEHTPQGATLREKLTSTDWRHLVWWERQSEPVAPVPAAPVVTPPRATSPPVSPPPVTARPKQSFAGVWGILFAVAVLLLLYWLLTRSAADTDTPKVKPKNTSTSLTDEPTRTTKKRRKTTHSAKKAKTTQKREKPAEDVSSDNETDSASDQ